MATSITTSIPEWLAGCTYDGNGGNDLRNGDITATWLDTGILTGSTVGVWAGVVGGAALKVSASSGMNVAVGPGSFVVPNTASAIAGGYRSTLASSGTLTVATSNPTNPRIDLVCATVVDNGNNTSFGEVQIITGTPALSPVAPSLPANSVSLAQVTVPANASSIVGGDIADTRTFTAAAGGIPIAPKTGGLPAGYNGLMVYDPASGSFYHMSAAGARQARVLPFAPVQSLLTSNTAVGTTIPGTTLLSATITTDGNTDIKITAKIPSITQTGSAGTVIFKLYVDSTQIDTLAIYAPGLGASATAGFTWVYTTSSVAGDTPSAGTHTIAWKGLNSSGVGASVVADSTDRAYLRVEPATL